MWPVTIADVLEARERIRGTPSPTALRRYAAVEEEVGYGIRLFVKHENHQPTQAFKARNGLAALTSLSEEERKKGVVGASRGNHGQGLAWAGQMLGIPVAICVPRGNNPEKNAAMRGFGAELIEQGDGYDAAVRGAESLAPHGRLTRAHRVRLLLRTTHNLAEGAGATGLAGLLALRETLAGKSVGICVSGGNIDQETLRRVVSREI